MHINEILFHPIKSNRGHSPLIVTHDGEFHADEIVGICLLKFVFGNVRIYRTRDPEIIEKGDFVLDVGGVWAPQKGLFDHHQKNYKGTYASAGMVLEWLVQDGRMDAKFAKYLNTIFIRGVDLQDIGRYPPQLGICTFSDMIKFFNPPFLSSSEEVSKRFLAALELTFDFLDKIKQKYIHNQKYKKKFSEILNAQLKEDQKILIIDDYIPWKEYILDEPRCNNILLIVFPVSHNKWIVHTIPKSKRKPYSDRIKLPASWAGLLDKEFAKETGIPESVFCHKQRFMAVFKNKESALKATKIILESERISSFY